MLQLLMAVVLLAFNVRYVGEAGARRYSALSDARAQIAHESRTTRVFDWLIIFNITVSAANAALAGYLGSWLELSISIGALALSLAAWSMGRSARSNVLAGFAQRGLDPLHPRELSLRCNRRQKQFGVVALVGYLTYRVFEVVAEQTQQPSLTGIALIGMVLAAGGGLGLVWSMAWRFGDEQPT